MQALVVDWTFTSGGVDLRACERLFIDHRRVSFFFFSCVKFLQ